MLKNSPHGRRVAVRDSAREKKDTATGAVVLAVVDVAAVVP